MATRECNRSVPGTSMDAQGPSAPGRLIAENPGVGYSSGAEAAVGAGPEVRLLVVDGRHLSRYGLCSILRQWMPHARIVGEATGRESIADLCAELRPHLVISELYMPGDEIDAPVGRCFPGGLEVCREIKATPRPPALLVYSACTSESVIAECVLSGVDSYVHKDREPCDLLSALRALANGEPGDWHYPERTDIDLIQRLIEDKSKLTYERRRVYDLALRGIKQGDMARLLGTSVDSVKSAKREIGRKLDAGWDRILIR